MLRLLPVIFYNFIRILFRRLPQIRLERKLFIINLIRIPKFKIAKASGLSRLGKCFYYRKGIFIPK